MTTMIAAKSYTSQARGLRAFVRENLALARAYGGDRSDDVARLLAGMRELEQRVDERYGLAITGKRVLDVGAGQRPFQATYLATQGNEVVAVDRDVFAAGWDVQDYLRVARTNGLSRALRTIGRKALGVDRRYGAELRRQVGFGVEPDLQIREMDAAALAFPSDSFDVVYSLAVLMHLDRPLAALDEMRRVVRPGGVVYLDLIPYTSPFGALDMRRLENGFQPLRWSHLRLRHRSDVIEGGFLNRLRLRDWEVVLTTALPGCELIRVQPGRAELEPEATRLRASGELEDYSLEELLTHQLVVLWQKADRSRVRTP